jgi:hypothetical protein
VARPLRAVRPPDEVPEQDEAPRPDVARPRHGVRPPDEVQEQHVAPRPDVTQLLGATP